MAKFKKARMYRIDYTTDLGRKGTIWMTGKASKAAMNKAKTRGDYGHPNIASAKMKATYKGFVGF